MQLKELPLALQIIILAYSFILCFLSILLLCLYKWNNDFQSRVKSKIDSTIFKYLDLYYEKNYVQLQENDLEMNSFRMRILERKNNNKIIYVCNFSNFFCLSCNKYNRNPIQNIINFFYNRIFFKIKQYWWKNSSIICFSIFCIRFSLIYPIQNIFTYIIGIYSYKPLEILMILTEPLDFFFFVFYLVLCAFRRDIKHRKNINVRSNVIVFFIEKAIIVAFLFFIIKMMLLIIQLNNENQRKIIRTCSRLGRMIFYLYVSKIFRAIRRVQIKNDCEEIKDESINNEILNFIFKNSNIGIEKLNNIIEKSIINDKLIHEELEKNFKQIVNNKLTILKNNIEIIESQKPKNIIVKKNSDSWLPVILIVISIIDILMTLVLLLVQVYSDYKKLYLDYTCDYIMIIIDLFDCVVYPFLSYKCLSKPMFTFD